MPPADHRLGDRPYTLPLAHGELDPADRVELRRLMEQVERDRGFRCESYKAKCLRRRLGVRMRARGVHRYADYAALLREDASEYERLLATFTINVSKFFRNPEVWEVLRQEVVPSLFRLDTPTVRIWSAGAAAGEEAYTLAIVLHEYARAHGLPDRLERFRILATDIDSQALTAAARGEYGEPAVSEVAPELRHRWFLPGPAYRVRPEIQAQVRLRRADLLKDRFPGQQHLILCRNVMIYFDPSAQESLFQRFHRALVPDGVLVLGKVETLFGESARRFRAIANRERIFRRL